MKKFEVGKKYFMTSACDSECRWEYIVTKRTDKSIWLDNGSRYVVANSYDKKEEIIYPRGKYSMAPILSADKEVVTEEATKQAEHISECTEFMRDLRLRALKGEAVERIIAKTSIDWITKSKELYLIGAIAMGGSISEEKAEELAVISFLDMLRNKTEAKKEEPKFKIIEGGRL